MFPNGSKIPQNSQVPSLTQQRDPNRSTLPAILPFANPCSKQSYTEGRLKAQPAPSEPFLHNYPSFLENRSKLANNIPQGEVGLLSKQPDVD